MEIFYDISILSVSTFFRNAQSGIANFVKQDEVYS